MNTVHFEGKNLRRLALAISTDSLPSPSSYTYTPDFVFDAPIPFPTWRTVVDLQNTGARFDTSPTAGVTLVGGIRANRALEVTGGTLTLEQEFERNGLENLLSRNAWIEAYRQ